ncbi:hypothetical protein MRX96_043070 [Rhipicephalus microplus]
MSECACCLALLRKSHCSQDAAPACLCCALRLAERTAVRAAVQWRLRSNKRCPAATTGSGRVRDPGGSRPNERATRSMSGTRRQQRHLHSLLEGIGLLCTRQRERLSLSA